MNCKAIVRNRIEAFTLIELLVVIAIIAIISAILFPVFSKVREKARQTTCASNMKQIGLGITQYTQDYDELMPPVWSDTSSGKMSYRGVVQPYIKSYGILKCPSNPVKDKLDWPEQNADQALGITCSYAAARYDGTHRGVFAYGSTGPVPTSIANISNPSSAIEVVESTATFPDFHVSVAEYFACKENTPSCLSGYAGNLFAGHSGYSNFLFADGHVKAMRPLSTLDAAEGGSGSTNLWTIDNGPFDSGYDLTNATSVLNYSQTLYK